ncbi:winged helix-turn-helix domain-containing protein [Dactylosporangium roseum]|uniref:Winged helix-turn-helix domain-containing protein n=1 Tax=Dactylosporangium roseum TaxID=47989 RepID=A0ABY5YWX7_9ACTN|nr:BTAD domain-containing putative transcriptional regulator [Dactylosporangium roseum]UWZ33886.1 winged helix-turn-helix domain-containing protein [Dactylosporangium roseum]
MVEPRFGVLGPLEVTLDERQVDLGGLRPRTLLAMLLSAGGQEVPFHRIVEGLWGAEPPATALGTVHSHLARLRRALEPDRPPRSPARVLVRVGAGYAVRPAPGCFDAERFAALAAEGHELVGRGRYGPARGTLDTALALWRGSAYADFPDAPFALRAARRLEEQRVQARIDRMAAETGLGRHEAAVVELSGLAREHPGRERVWQLLAVALFRSGRRVEALDVLREARSTLRERFGMDPGPALRDLEAAMLRQDAVLPDRLEVAAGAAEPARPDESGKTGEPAEPAGSPLPVPATELVGRAAELTAVTDLLREARVVTVTGQPGVGKSRLVLEYAHRQAALTGVPPVLWPAAPGPATRLVVVDGGGPATAAAVRRLTDEDPRLRVLAAGREPLGLPGEVLLELGALPPDPAVELFVARAVEADPGRRADRADPAGAWPDPAERELVAAVCAAVGRLPRAVEQAATLSRALPLPALLVHLREAPAVLLGPAVDPLDGPLAPDDALLLGRLAVFDGGWDLGAMAVVAPDPAGPARLARLVDRSLVQVVRDRRGGAAHRFRLGRPLRQYAAGLIDDDERIRTVRRHRDWLRRLAVDAASELRTDAAVNWLRRLHAERRNVRAALNMALADGDGAAAVDIAGGVAWYWFHHGATAEGTAWLRASLTAAGQDRSVAGSAARGRARLGLSALRSIAGDVPGAVTQARAAVDEAERAGHDHLRADAFCGLSFVVAASGDAGLAGSAALRSFAAAEAGGWPDLRAQAGMVSGHARYLAGDLGGAAELLAEARRAARACGYGWVVTVAGWLGVEVALDRARHEEARHAALALTDRLRNAPEVSSWLVTTLSLARALTLTGDGESGALLWGAVTGVGRRVGLAAQHIGRAHAHRNRHGAPARRHAAAYVRGLEMTRTEAAALIATLRA